MQGSNSEWSMAGTGRYTRSYIGNGVGSQSFSENVMPANRIRTAYRMWKDREEVELPKEVLWGNMAPEHEATARCRKERMQRKNQNEKLKEKYKTEKLKKGGRGEKENRKMRDGEGRWALWGWGEHPAEVAICSSVIWQDNNSAWLLVQLRPSHCRVKGRSYLLKDSVFPASGFKELQLIIEAFTIMSISGTPARTLMLIQINRSIIMLSSFG